MRMKNIFGDLLKRSRHLGCLILTVALAHVANAERVMTVNANGEKGHAWMFGANDEAGNLACWVAVPTHVIASRGKLPDRFKFNNTRGQEGVAGQVLAKSDFDANLDLEFAPVVAGFKGDDCGSRLGLPAYNYRQALRGSVELNLANLLQTSQQFFKVKVVSSGIDDMGGALLVLAVQDVNDAEKARKGLSGSTALYERNGRIFPFAMVTEVKSDTQEIVSLRYDRVAEAFKRAGRTQNSDELSSRNIQNYTFGTADLVSVGDANLIDLQISGGCFKAASTADMKAVNLSFNMTTDERVGYIKFNIEEGCASGGQTLFVDRKFESDGNWDQISTCQISAVGETRCRVPAGAAKYLRIRARRGEPLALSQVDIQ